MISRARYLTFFAAMAVTMLIGFRLVHAGTGTAAPDPGVSWQLWIVAGLAAIAGVETLLKGLSMILHAIAPRTKTPIDDNFAASVDALHDKVDLLRTDFTELAGTLVPAAKTAPSLAAVPARNPQAGKASLSVAFTLTAIAVVAFSVIFWLPGCTKAQLKADAVTAEHELINCTAQQLGATPALDPATLVAVVNLVVTEKAKCSPAGSLDWTCVEHDLEAEGKTLGGCTLVRLLASPPTPGVAARVAADDPGRVALERFRAAVAGGAMFHTASGDI